MVYHYFLNHNIIIIKSLVICLCVGVTDTLVYTHTSVDLCTGSVLCVKSHALISALLHFSKRVYKVSDYWRSVSICFDCCHCCCWYWLLTSFRYVGDMLAWLHQATASEKEHLEALLKQVKVQGMLCIVTVWSITWISIFSILFFYFLNSLSVDKSKNQTNKWKDTKSQFHNNHKIPIVCVQRDGLDYCHAHFVLSLYC